MISSLCVSLSSGINKDVSLRKGRTGSAGQSPWNKTVATIMRGCQLIRPCEALICVKNKVVGLYVFQFFSPSSIQNVIMTVFYGIERGDF